MEIQLSRLFLEEEGNSKAKPKAHVEAPFTLAELNDALLHVPTFVPNFTAVKDFECQQHGKIDLPTTVKGLQIVGPSE